MYFMICICHVGYCWKWITEKECWFVYRVFVLPVTKQRDKNYYARKPGIWVLILVLHSQVSGSKEHPFLISQFPCVRNTSTAHLVFCSELTGGLWSYQGLHLGKTCFWASSDCWQNSGPWGFRMETPIFCWLFPRPCSPLLSVVAVPGQVELPIGPNSLPLQASKGAPAGVWIHGFWYRIPGVTSRHLCHFLFVKCKSQVLTYTQWLGLYIECEHGDHPGVCLPYS